MVLIKRLILLNSTTPASAAASAFPSSTEEGSCSYRSATAASACDYEFATGLHFQEILNMSTNRAITYPKLIQSDVISKSPDQFAFGPIALTGTNDSLYERHLVFDN